MVAALMTASTCGNSRMTFIAASTLAHLDHEADVQRQSHADEDDQHDPVASPHIWVKVCHVDFVGPVEIRPRTPASAALEHSSLNASPQHDLGEHRCEQDEEVEDRESEQAHRRLAPRRFLTAPQAI